MKKKIPLFSITRHPVPALPEGNAHISEEGRLSRSWPVAPGEFFRLYADEPLELEITITRKMQNPRVMLHTNLFAPEGSWGEIEFKKENGNRFSLSTIPARPGIYQFKIRYSPDDGKTWFWDRTPFSKVIVDPPAARSVRLYTLIPAVSGHIGDWKDELSRICDLGFNQVHLLPFTRMGESLSPYAAADLFSIDPGFLIPKDPRDGLSQFEDFVNHAIRLKIGLCIDLVLNHIGLTSDMARKAPEWIVPDKNESNGLLRAGCWHMNSWIKWDDLVRIHYDHPEEKIRSRIWDYMKAYALFWGNYAAATDGMVRLDNLHSSHPGFVASMLHELRSVFPGLVIQAEFFSDTNTLTKTASESEINLMLANPWEYPYAEGLRSYLGYIHETGSKIRFLTPLVTHDTGAVAELYGAPEAVVPRYFVTALFSTGQTGLVQGAEYGVKKRIEFIGRFPRMKYPDTAPYAGAVKKINAIHDSYAIFQRHGNLEFVDETHGGLMVALRRDHNADGGHFLLCANFDTSKAHWLDIPAASWRTSGRTLRLNDLMSGKATEVSGDTFRLELPACGTAAYRFEYL